MSRAGWWRGRGRGCHSPLPLAPGSVPPVSLVLYDACPKSLRAGVWWPQTKFGLLASVPCPRGALGEYLGAGALLRGGLSLACGSRLFLRRVAWFLQRWEGGGFRRAPHCLLGVPCPSPTSLSLRLFLLASGQDCGVQVRGTCLLRCAAPPTAKAFADPPAA